MMFLLLIIVVTDHCYMVIDCPTAAVYLTREFRACARASCKYDVENGTRSLDWSIPVNLFFDFGLLSAFNSFW